MRSSKRTKTVEVQCLRCGHTSDGEWDRRRGETEQGFINKSLGPALEQLKGWRRTANGWLCGCCTGIKGSVAAKLPNDKEEFTLKGVQHPDGQITDIRISPVKKKGR